MKKLLVIICIFACMLFSGCSSESKLYVSTENKQVVSKEIEEKKLPVEEVVKRVETDFEMAKKQYKNLIMGNIRPYCTNIETVSDIKYYYLGNYKGITNPIEMYNELLGLLQQYIGNDLEDNFFYCDYYMDHPGEDVYSSFGEYKEALFKGEDLQPCSLAYLKQDEEKMKYAALEKNLMSVNFNKGEVYSSIPKETKETTEYPGATQARFLCENIATYYVNNLDNNLDDIYKLKNGELSIRDGISFVENYLNNGLYVEDSNDDVKLKVTSVEVFKVCEEYCCYRYRITREILGLTKICIDDGSFVNRKICYDLSEAYMLYTNEVDEYYGISRILDYKKINEMDKIIPLSTALEIISEGIGGNSSYEIENISLGYLDLYDTSEDNLQGSMTASWILECKNLLDNSRTEFYINVNTGDVTVV